MLRERLRCFVFHRIARLGGQFLLLLKESVNGSTRWACRNVGAGEYIDGRRSALLENHLGLYG